MPISAAWVMPIRRGRRRALRMGPLAGSMGATSMVAACCQESAAVHPVVDLAPPGRHFEEVQIDVGVLVDVFAGEPRPGFQDFHVELFMELADQGFAGGFAGFDLAAGKLPVARVEGVGSALPDQKAAVGPGDDGGGHMHDLSHCSKRPA
jgi:hypothetical protein